MDELQIFKIVARQKIISDELQRIVTNIKKDSRERKTAEYRKTRLQALEALWLEFHSNHQQIENVVKADTPYVQSKTYERIRQIYEDIKQSLQQGLPQDEDNMAGAAPIQPETDTQPKLLDTKRVDFSISDSTSDVVKALRRQDATAQSLQRFMSNLTKVDSESWTPTFCSVKITALQNYWAEMENTHRLVYEQTDNPTKYGYDLERYYGFEDEVQAYLVQLTLKLNHAEAKSQPTTYTAMQGKAAVNLPNITLPKFDGDYLKWTQFKDLFNELVHKQQIGDCQKLFYLKTTLTGEAEKAESQPRITTIAPRGK